MKKKKKNADRGKIVALFCSSPPFLARSFLQTFPFLSFASLLFLDNTPSPLPPSSLSSHIRTLIEMLRSTTTSVLASTARMLRQPLTSSTTTIAFQGRFRNAAAAASTSRLFSISTSTFSPPPPPQHYNNASTKSTTQTRHPRVLVTGMFVVIVVDVLIFIFWRRFFFGKSEKGNAARKPERASCCSLSIIGHVLAFLSFLRCDKRVI